MAKKKIDLSRERELELRGIIQVQGDLYKINSERVSKLRKRQNTEDTKFQLKYFKNLLKNIPIKEEDSNLLSKFKEPQFLYLNEWYEICRFKLGYNADEVSVDFGDDWRMSLDFHAIQVQYINTIISRLQVTQDDFFVSRNKILKNYENLIQKIDVSDCANLMNTAKRELKQITNKKLLEVDKKFIFDGYVRLRRTLKKGEYIKSLTIKKLMVKFCMVEVTSEYGMIGVMAQQKYPIENVLNLLSNKKWKYEKHIERAKKMERILEEMGE